MTIIVLNKALVSEPYSCNNMVSIVLVNSIKFVQFHAHQFIMHFVNET